jgi:hypothetical protein
MAYVSRLSDYVRGGVVGGTFQEGLAVKITNSGVHNDLPVFMGASTNDTVNVGILFAVPDQFSRPTDSDLYKASPSVVWNQNNGFSDPIDTGKTFYKVGKSTLWNPTLTSGELGQLHRGGTYAVPSGTFIDSANIRIPGNMIRVGANNQWEYTATQSQAVGVTEEYNTVTESLIFTLWH